MAKKSKTNKTPKKATVKQVKNSKKERLERIKEYQFKPGQSGNPKGRPKGKTLSEAIKDILLKQHNVKVGEITKKAEGYEVLAHAWFSKGQRGDMSAIKEILDRTEGKVTEKIQHSGSIDHRYTEEEIDDFFDNLDISMAELYGSKN